MVSPLDAPASQLIKEVAKELEGKIEAPDWSKFVKTGVNRIKPPVDKDWWFVRAASILRTIYRNAPVGVSRLRSKYGGIKHRGRKPDQFRKSSGNILRKILQQLDKAGLTAQKKDGVKRGRILTPAGMSLLAKSAGKIKKQ